MKKQMSKLIKRIALMQIYLKLNIIIKNMYNLLNLVRIFIYITGEKTYIRKVYQI